MESTLERLWESEYFKTAIMIVVVIAIVFGFWFGAETVLGTKYPAEAVVSGSMSRPRGSSVGTPDDGWSHPFDPTLHIGDIIVIQGVKPEDIYAAPYNETGRSGDIIVFRASSESDELIVHRAVGRTTINGEVYFITQGDNNAVPGPYSPTPAENVVGKVILRIPWIGNLVLFMHDSSAIYIIVALIIILIVIEFALPSLRTNEEARPKENGESTVETHDPYLDILMQKDHFLNRLVRITAASRTPRKNIIDNWNSSEIG